MKGNMVNGNPLKLILNFALPLLLGNLFQQTYNMVDAAIVGQTLGSSSLAAVGATSSVQFLVLGFCMGTCVGFGIPVAQRFGAEDYDGLRKYVYCGGILSAVIAVVMAVGTVALCALILELLQVPADIFSQSYSYLAIIFAGIPCTILYNYLSSILRAIGDSKTPFYFLAMSAVLNIFLDFFCIVVLKWGVAGAAIATIFSQGVSGILCLLLIVKKFHILHPHKEDRHMNCKISKDLIVMGMPMGLQFSITAIGSMVMQSANNGLGTIYVSGFTAGMKIKAFMMCPFDAIATAVSTFASQNYGAGKMDRVKTGIRQGTAIGVGYGAIAGVILFFFGRTLSMLFVSASEAAVLDASALYLRRMGIFWWTLGILNVLRTSVQGLGYASRAVMAGGAEMFCRCFVAILLVPVFHYDAITFCDQVAWVGGCLYIIPACILTVRHLEQEMKSRANLDQLQA